MKIYLTNVNVDDQDKALKFYQEGGPEYRSPQNPQQSQQPQAHSPQQMPPQQ
jgi:hypothetical protein